jgi:putative membrane protein
MTRFLARLIFAALGLALAAYLLPGVSYNGVFDLLIAALLLGVVNAILRPVLFVLTLPLTIVTLGLFLLVLNAAMIGLVAWMLPGFTVDGAWSGILAAIITGLASWIGGVVIGDAKRR